MKNDSNITSITREGGSIRCYFFSIVYRDNYYCDNYLYFFKTSSLFLCSCVLVFYFHACMYTTCVPYAYKGQRSYRKLWVVKWLLGLKARSSLRERSSHNHWVNSPAPTLILFRTYKRLLHKHTKPRVKLFNDSVALCLYKWNYDKWKHSLTTFLFSLSMKTISYWICTSTFEIR